MGHHEKTKLKIIGREVEESQIKGINEFFQKILERTFPTEDRYIHTDKRILYSLNSTGPKKPPHGTWSIKKIL